MGKTLLDLAKSLEKRLSLFDKEVLKVSNEIALELIKNLVFLTPVDTSKALSNWIINNNDASSAIKAHFVGKAGSTQSQSAAAAIQLAELALKSRKIGQPILISNLAPYIRRLNYEGYSKQGGYFVELSILKTKKQIKNINIKI